MGAATLHNWITVCNLLRWLDEKSLRSQSSVSLITTTLHVPSVYTPDTGRLKHNCIRIILSCPMSDAVRA